ncbi:helix-turn-helix domain-containing protein [Streptomyces sp. NPDC007856]|uniref:helix-turn-helix domain-containing protein n=1 Tax=Streptomyces sp. NPDC007856 TaxID=3364781 RepID=UPI0036BDD4F5
MPRSHRHDAADDAPKRRYEVIHRMAAQGFSARRIAALLDVSESGYYAWRARTPSP